MYDSHCRHTIQRLKEATKAVSRNPSSRARFFGGWKFDPRDHEKVRSLCRQLFIWPSKSIPVASTIAIRSSEGIAGISLKIRGCARVKDKINESTGEKSARKRKRLLIFWRFRRSPFAQTHVEEWRIRPSTSQGLSTILREDTLVMVENRSNQLDDGSALRSFALSD